MNLNLHPVHTPVWAALLLLFVAGAAAMLPRVAADRPDTAWLAAPWRATRWLLAGHRWHRAARRAWAAGADLATGWALAAPVVAVPPRHDVPPPDADNACKLGRAHCRECRLDGDCRFEQDPDARPAYAAGRPLPRPGRHDVSQVVARWLAGSWWDTPLPAELRLQLARMAGAVRVPVQLGFPVGPLP